MATIPVTGIPSSFRAPGSYVEIVFAQGASSAAAGARTNIVVMPMLAAGAAWTANTVYGPIKNEQEALDGGGAGSPIHRALRRGLQSNRNAKWYALPYAPTSGGSPVAATATVTWTTDPTGSGVASVWVCGELIEYGFNSNDTVTTIAAGQRDAVNARTHLPVTATAAAGVLTISAKVAGPSMGDGTSGAIMVRAEIDLGKGTTVATTGALSLGAGAVGVDGTTTEAANFASALAIVNAARYYYMGTSMWDATALSSFETHIANKSEPKVGLRSVGIAAFTGALAAAQALATARNYERMQIAWQNGAEDDPASIVANMMGVRQKREETDTKFNFDGYRLSDWLVPGAASQADWPDLDDIDDAVTDGLTPIASDDNGSYIAMSCTTRSKDSSGSTDDFRALETHRVSVADEFVDTLLVRHKLRYGATALKDDKRFADGTIDHNQRVGPNVVTPSLWKSLPLQLLDEFDDADKVQRVSESKESLRAVKDPSNGGRLEAGLDLIVVDLFHQLTLRVAETSTG